MKKTAAEILLDLVAIPSVSDMSNRPVIEHALDCLERDKWAIQLYDYRDDSGTEKVNLVAVPGHNAGATAELALVCHTDTVPFDRNWNEAVHPVIRDGKVYGRGSCDVKGFLACLLEALTQIDVRHLSRPLMLILTADEEVGCLGAKYLADKNIFQSRYAIVGEPTGLRPVSAGKGYAIGKIVVRGEEAHSAFPQRGRSAIRYAARILEQLDDVAQELASREDARFDPPFTTLNIGLISGGTAKNVVPGECRMTVEWRSVPGQDPQWAAQLIQKELEQLGRQTPGFHAELHVTRVDPPFTSGDDKALVSLFESLSQQPAATAAFGTEAPHVSSMTSEVIVFGPGDMTVAHKTGEFVPVDELHACVAQLTTAIEQLCG